MKRIASLFLFGSVLLCACTDKRIPGPEIVDPPSGKAGSISLRVLVPPGSISTYADTDASEDENHIDTLYVDLYQGGSLIKEDKFFGNNLKVTGPNDSILMVGYEVDNITTGELTAKVYANCKTVKIISDEILIPAGDAATSFFMSGEITSQSPLIYNGTAYEGTVHMSRNVAKVRVNISKNSVFFPLDLKIRYDEIKIRVLDVANQTSLFPGTADAATSLPGFGYTNYTERGPAPLANLRNSSSFSGGDTGTGGQIDSFYIYENHRSSYDAGNTTKVKVTIPTESPSEGAKIAEYTYTLSTPTDGNTLKRNYIYTLDIKVRGQRLEPVITVSVLPWDDISVDGNIYGTYLTLDKSEITFDSSGEATINFCTDAQAIYFDFSEFNGNNPMSINGTGDSIVSVGIDPNNGLAPAGFESGQILLDQQHCGSFGFKLQDLATKFPEFPAVNFSGKICLKAGNIVKCLTFPGIRTYDAHFIVGDSIFNWTEKYTAATVYEDPTNNASPGWLKVSENRIYATGDMKDSYTNATSHELYLHLDENLTGYTRTGSISVISNGTEKKLRISQLPAIPVGRFGYNNILTDDSIYGAMLYTEQLYEYPTMPRYLNLSPDDGRATPDNALYNGRMTAVNPSVFNWNAYENFDYQNTVFQAINYCAHKNRITSNTSVNTDLKWYLPAQAQLMGMWISYNSYKDETTSNFKYPGSVTPADYFWSSTDNFWNSIDNSGYKNDAQYMNFEFGNIGHRLRETKYWVRCVRDGGAVNSMVSTTNGSVIDFGNGDGMPAGSYTTMHKNNNAGGDELSDNNKTLYKTLRVAIADHASGVPWTINACQGYSESGDGGATWRLPTQRELQAIWILQSEINRQLSTFNLLADDYYWSATDSKETNGTNAWTIFGSRTVPGSSGNAPNQPKDSQLSVRCVSEL
ncbi:MAG: hypothetical protein LBL33_00255 [Tannerella sp.]|nr:hypothetical protein [Tannerella sp.]